MHNNSIYKKNDNFQDVTAIVTAMTEGEKPFLPKALESIFLDPCIAQVILCVEETNAWLESIVSTYINDARLYIVRLPLMPQGAVRNKALEYVQQPWVSYCDGDDVWCNGKTHIQRNFANQYGCDFVGADHFLTDEEGKVRAFGLARYMPMPSSWMVRTEIMKTYPFKESIQLMGMEDGEWWVRTANLVKKARCPKTLLLYRVRPSSSSTSKPSKKRKTKVIQLAKIPILGFGVLCLTYFAWLFTRRKDYTWLPSWGEEPSM